MNFNLKPSYRIILLWLLTIIVSVVSVDIVFVWMDRNQKQQETLKNITRGFDYVRSEIKRNDTEIKASANALSTRKELISSASMISTYQDIQNYSPIIFDVEKENILTQISHHANSAKLDIIIVFDANKNLIAYYYNNADDRKFSGIVTYENGNPKLTEVINTSSTPRTIATLPHEIFEAPNESTNQVIINHSHYLKEGLLLETSTPLIKTSTSGKNSTVGFIKTGRLLGTEFTASVSSRTGLIFGITIPGTITIGQFQNVFPNNIPPAFPELTDTSEDVSKGRLSHDAYFAIGRTIVSDHGPGAAFLLGRGMGEMTAEETTFRNASIIVLITIILLITPFGIYFIKRFIAKPVESVVAGFKALQNGQYVKLDPIPGQDEMSQMISSFNTMSEQLKNRDQKIRDLNATLEASVDNRTQKLLERTQELTESARKLTETKAFNEQILNSAGEGIYGLDEDGVAIFINPAACKMLGYSEDEIIGKAMHALIHHSYPDGSPYPRDICPMYRTISEDERHTVTDEVLWCKDGSAIPVRYTSTQNRKDGKVIGAVITFNDISLDKEREKELQRSNQELQHFASAAAHDLQEPLRKIQSFSERLENKYMDVVDDQGKAYIERIVGAATRMRMLIDDLLNFSRVTSKAQPFKETNMDLLLAEVVDDLDISIRQANAEIEASPLPVIDADKTQMRQLLQNIISNAIKFRKEDEPIKIMISATVGAETLHGTYNAKTCKITIKDTGIGFDSKFKDKIFGIFERLHGRSEYPGTGIGLATCKKIVERHGGEIDAESSPGNGATFLIFLPVTHQGSIKLEES